MEHWREDRNAAITHNILHASTKLLGCTPAMVPASSLLSSARSDSWEGVHGDHLELARNSACKVTGYAVLPPP